VAEVGICDANPQLLNEYGDKYGIAKRYADIQAILAAPEWDAVHLLTPIPTHGQLSLAVLKAGKHCACTVPMGTTLDELFAVVAAQRATGLNYMMMETAAYTYYCLHVQDMIARGEIGPIQFLRGAHYQDMEGWPAYWHGLPPMHYATHAIAPPLLLAKARATRVHCFGSGQMRAELVEQYHNPYPIETAIFQLDRSNLAMEITRSLFHTARDYAEIFSVLGETGSFEWYVENDLPLHTQMLPASQGRGRPVKVNRVIPGSFRDRLPVEIRAFDGHVVVPDPANPHQSIVQGGSHHGSHPHLVHEFVSSIVENRQPAINAVTGANWTAAGICAHQSALHGGAAVQVPAFA